MSGGRWLFSRRLDLLAFGGSAVAAGVIVVVAALMGAPVTSNDAPSPPWLWVTVVLAVDVAHVWGSAVLVYFDPVEVRRRLPLYLGVPITIFAVAWALSSESEAYLWTALAYVAVFHFIRQQVGWVKLYRAKEPPESDPARRRWGRVIDEGAVYAATVGPIVWWHAQLPTSIAWFVDGDFITGLPAVVGVVALAIEVVWLAAYVARSVRRALVGDATPGKDLVVAATALSWWLGIVAFANDVVFTATNVLIHGVPYVVLVVVTARRRQQRGLSLAVMARHGALAIVATLWAAALIEETLWDRLVWHERGWLFVLPAVDVGDWRAVVVALLVVPQATHYVLDAFVWRRHDNPTLTTTTT